MGGAVGEILADEIDRVPVGRVDQREDGVIGTGLRCRTDENVIQGKVGNCTVVDKTSHRGPLAAQPMDRI